MNRAQRRQRERMTQQLRASIAKHGIEPMLDKMFGPGILDQLRGYFPGAASFLMDRETLLAHRLHWGEEPDPARHDLARLTPEEAAVYDDLRFDRHQPRLRLEQERVGFGWLCDRLPSIPSGALMAPPPRS